LILNKDAEIMPLNTLIETCYHQKTNWGENRSRVSINPEPNERILFFVIDNQSNKRSKIREDFKIDGKICDLLVFFSKLNNCSDSITKHIICLIECEGKNVVDAAEQIINTYDNLCNKIRFKHIKNVEWRAIIRHTHCSPDDSRRVEVILNKKFGHRKWKKIESDDIGKFLRS
jgi:hypothetical protein